MTHSGPAAASSRVTRDSRQQQRRNALHGANRKAVLISVFAAMMMAIAVEVYYADLLPEEAPLPHRAHLQAFVAACAGFLPAMLCLQRLNSRADVHPGSRPGSHSSFGAWLRALRLTAPWLLLIPEALVASLYQPRWYLLLAATLLCGIAAYLIMLRIARRLPRN